MDRNVLLVLGPFIDHRLPHSPSSGGQSGDAINDVHHQMEPVHVVHHHHVKGRRGRPLFLVATDMQVVVVGSAIAQQVNQRRIAVERKDDLPIPGKDLDLTTAKIGLGTPAAVAPPNTA